MPHCRSSCFVIEEQASFLLVFHSILGLFLMFQTHHNQETSIVRIRNFAIIIGLISVILLVIIFILDSLETTTNNDPLAAEASPSFLLVGLGWGALIGSFVAICLLFLARVLDSSSHHK